MKKKFRSRLVAALVAVTAITCCFLGSTFAKYTSSSEKSATAQVARWEVTNISDNTTKNNFEFTADMLSPTVAEGKTTNTLTSNALTITNNSNVSADITVGTPELTVNYLSTKTDFSDFTTEKYGMELSAAEDAVFTATFTADKTATNGKYTLAKGETLTLTVTITWTTQATNGDLIDTYFGMYAETLVANLELTATQATQVPTAA